MMKERRFLGYSDLLTLFLPLFGFFTFTLIYRNMNNTIIIYASLFISILTGLFSLYIFILKYREKTKDIGRASIHGPRERIESQIYDLNEILLSDPERLFDNTALLLQHPQTDLTTSSSVPNFSFFNNLGIDLANTIIKEKSIFCLMPFHKSFLKTYETINYACKKAGYECCRSDMPYNPGNILRQIISLIAESQLIIAVLDGKNPNVFYEIGIAHSIGKTVILIANMAKVNDIPFNLRSDRLLLYSNPGDLNDKLINILQNIHYAE